YPAVEAAAEELVVRVIYGEERSDHDQHGAREDEDIADRERAHDPFPRSAGPSLLELALLIRALLELALPVWPGIGLTVLRPGIRLTVWLLVLLPVLLLVP